ncbi:hypothetical protein [Pseudoduganella albidiflava]|uniref:Pilus assembly protein n=1 Tax=Pseudoduganella albidiflava TaxID=321983 RepID=A0A411X100_9BURK|nr:hypothetical protein [Pseudoduganella albidiflava]QBI02656.1 hypothetical protein EYF70_18750 [Pseudoduganella albidiflava]GGY40938.1 hypothetical protein GCM10007387_23580 [Pseudoduganella albidiflava]
MNHLANHLRLTAVTVAIVATLGGCAARDTSANGGSVRAIMASQVVPPQPRPASGTDAGTAVAGYANYVRSYVTPTPQGDSAMVGSGIGNK